MLEAQGSAGETLHDSARSCGTNYTSPHVGNPTETIQGVVFDSRRVGLPLVGHILWQLDGLGRGCRVRGVRPGRLGVPPSHLGQSGVVRSAFRARGVA